MARRHRHSFRGKAVGQRPGTLNVSPDAAQPVLRVTRFDAARHETFDSVAASDLARFAAGDASVWIEVIGLGAERPLLDVALAFDIPRLALEDVLNTPQRPKVDAYDDALFIIVRFPSGSDCLTFDQIACFARGRHVITFQERATRLLEPGRQRIADPDSQTRRLGANYLVYRMIDALVDSYFPHLDRLDERLGVIETRVVEHPSARPLRELYEIRRELGSLMRVCVPMRDMVGSLRRDGTHYFHAHTQPFLRDVHDHAAQLVEFIEHHREEAVEIQDLIVGSLNMRMNDVMKVLTAATLVFLPLTLITGIYGMNFEHMPELSWRYGYFVVLAVLVAIGVAVFRWLKTRGWLRLED
jgi:magnesium transporter